MQIWAEAFAGVVMWGHKAVAAAWCDTGKGCQQTSALVLVRFWINFWFLCTQTPFTAAKLSVTFVSVVILGVGSCRVMAWGQRPVWFIHDPDAKGALAWLWSAPVFVRLLGSFFFLSWFVTALLEGHRISRKFKTTTKTNHEHLKSGT